MPKKALTPTMCCSILIFATYLLLKAALNLASVRVFSCLYLVFASVMDRLVGMNRQQERDSLGYHYGKLSL